MFSNDRGEVCDLSGGTGWRSSGRRLVELVERRGFALCLFSLFVIGCLYVGKREESGFLCCTCGLQGGFLYILRCSHIRL